MSIKYINKKLRNNIHLTSDKSEIRLGQIFSVAPVGNLFSIQEECDMYFDVLLTKEEAVKVFEDIIYYIKNVGQKL